MSNFYGKMNSLSSGENRLCIKCVFTGKEWERQSRQFPDSTWAFPLPFGVESIRWRKYSIELYLPDPAGEVDGF
jgi:hypothetical protein